MCVLFGLALAVVLGCVLVFLVVFTVSVAIFVIVYARGVLDVCENIRSCFRCGAVLAAAEFGFIVVAVVACAASCSGLYDHVFDMSVLSFLARLQPLQ